MTSSLYLSRLSFRRDEAAVAPLIEVLEPTDDGAALATAHRLMWTVMPEDVQNRHTRARDTARANQNPPPTAPFLWRSDEPRGLYYLLGPEPAAASPYFQIETKPFAPVLASGDRLAFELRLNATVNRKVGETPDGKAIRKRSDIAMDRMHAEEAAGDADLASRGERRLGTAAAAVQDWLAQQGAQHGFDLAALTLKGYQPVRLPRAGRAATIGVFDVAGVLTVREPEDFLLKLTQGLGRSKAFGCGLMLIRRTS